MSEVIRQAAAAHHYLAVFDNHAECPLYLGRSGRLASAAQRIVLYAKDRGCTRPGRTEPAYHGEAHHDDGWAAARSPTDIDKLSLACGPDNRLIEETGWTTRKRKDAAALRGITAGSGGLNVPVGGFAPALPRHAGGLPAQRHNIRVCCGGDRFRAGCCRLA